MTLGTKLKKLRTEKGLTQKDLADQLHVTFQTVSKWENEENEPDIATLKELAKIYEVSVDYLISEEELEPKKEKEPVVEKVVEAPAPINKTIIIHQKELHVCAKCGKEIEDEEDLVSEDVTKKERHGKHTRTVSVGQTYYHKACLEQVKQERARAAATARKIKTHKDQKKAFIWAIIAGVVSLGISLGVLLAVPACKEALHPGLAVLFSVLISYALFSDLYCIISGSYIADVFLGVSGWSIKMPGVIFSWDIDGIAWAIAMKIFLAILGFALGVFVLLLAVAISSILAMVSFPFVLINNIHTGYANSL